MRAGLLVAAAIVLLVGLLSAQADTRNCVRISQFAEFGAVHAVGNRALVGGNGSLLFDWSSFSLSFSVESASDVSVVLVDNGSQYDVILDGTIVSKLVTQTSSKPPPVSYPILAGLDPSVQHAVTLRKRTEALLGISQLVALEACAAAATAPQIAPLPPSKRRLRMQVIGDSLTCGYGVLGTYPCSYSPATQNVFSAWASLTASALDAEADLICWSGKGIVRNYGAPGPSSPDPMPIFWERTLGNVNRTDWAGSNYDIVVVVLGGNDFSTPPNPSNEVWSRAVVSFVKEIRAANPGAFIVTGCGPLSKDPCPLMRSTTQEDLMPFDSRISFAAMNVFNASDPLFLGCSGHPNVKGQKLMAAAMIQHLTSILPLLE